MEMLSKQNLFHNWLMVKCASPAEPERVRCDGVADRHLISTCGGESCHTALPPAGTLQDK